MKKVTQTLKFLENKLFLLKCMKYNNFVIENFNISLLINDKSKFEFTLISPFYWNYLNEKMKKKQNCLLLWNGILKIFHLMQLLLRINLLILNIFFHFFLIKLFSANLNFWSFYFIRKCQLTLSNYTFLF